MGLFSSLFGSGKRDTPEPAEPEVNDEEAPGVALEDLREALDSPEGALRVDASRALLERWRGGDAQAAEAIAPRLADLLDDDEPLVRLAALGGVRLLRKPENLEKCASGTLALLVDPVAQVRTAAVWAALRLPGDAARQQIHSLLKSTEAISALMSLGDAAALPEIAQLFEDESLGDFDRTLVAAALSRFGDARGAAHLVSRIESDSDDRPIAAEWAGRLGVQDAVPALAELADLEGDPARGAAMRALGRLHAPGAEDRLQRFAGSADFSDDLRMDAAEGLAELGTPTALELLKKLAEQGEPAELKQLCQELLVEVAAGQQGPT